MYTEETVLEQAMEAQQTQFHCYSAHSHAAFQSPASDGERSIHLAYSALPTRPPAVSVVLPSLLSMHCHVQKVAQFPSIRHNEIKEYTAYLLPEICYNV